MLSAIAVEDINALKNINAFRNLALIVASTPSGDRAWYLFDDTATDVADNENIVAPTIGGGRWFKMNNTTNNYNLIATEVNIAGTYSININNIEIIRLIFSNTTQLSFSTTIRNGKFAVFLDRNSTTSNITWNDSRIVWTANRGQPFDFLATNNSAYLEFFSINNVIYCTNVIRY